jgi:hypothetical protein
MRIRKGWMDSIDFDHEVGRALGGNKIYPNEQDLRAHNPCIGDPALGNDCTAKRVYVVDADEFDKEVKKRKKDGRMNKAGEWEVLAKDGDVLTLKDLETGREFGLEMEPGQAANISVGNILKGTIKPSNEPIEIWSRTELIERYQKLRELMVDARMVLTALCYPKIAGVRVELMPDAREMGKKILEKMKDFGHE